MHVTPQLVLLFHQNGLVLQEALHVDELHLVGVRVEVVLVGAVEEPRARAHLEHDDAEAPDIEGTWRREGLFLAASTFEQYKLLDLRFKYLSCFIQKIFQSVIASRQSLFFLLSGGQEGQARAQGEPWF